MDSGQSDKLRVVFKDSCQIFLLARVPRALTTKQQAKAEDPKWQIHVVHFVIFAYIPLLTTPSPAKYVPQNFRGRQLMYNYRGHHPPEGLASKTQGVVKQKQVWPSHKNFLTLCTCFPLLLYNQSLVCMFFPCQIPELGHSLPVLARLFCSSHAGYLILFPKLPSNTAP